MLPPRGSRYGFFFVESAFFSSMAGMSATPMTHADSLRADSLRADSLKKADSTKKKP